MDIFPYLFHYFLLFLCNNTDLAPTTMSFPMFTLYVLQWEERKKCQMDCTRRSVAHALQSIMAWKRTYYYETIYSHLWKIIETNKIIRWYIHSFQRSNFFPQIWKRFLLSFILGLSFYAAQIEFFCGKRTVLFLCCSMCSIDFSELILIHIAIFI